MLHPAGDEREDRVVSRRRHRFDIGDGCFELGIRKNRSEGFCALGCHPVCVALDRGARGAALRDELVEERLPRAGFFGCSLEYFGVALPGLGQCNQGEQRVVQFVGVAHIGPSFLAHFGNGRRDRAGQLPREPLPAACGAFRRRGRGALRAARRRDRRKDSRSESRARTATAPAYRRPRSECFHREFPQGPASGRRCPSLR